MLNEKSNEASLNLLQHVMIKAIRDFTDLSASSVSNDFIEIKNWIFSRGRKKSTAFETLSKVIGCDPEKLRNHIKYCIKKVKSGGKNEGKKAKSNIKKVKCKKPIVCKMVQTK